MPIYEYLCLNCEAGFEKLVMGQAGIIYCPSCATDRVTRQLSVFATRSNGRFTSSVAGGCGNCGNCQGGCGRKGHHH